MQKRHKHHTYQWRRKSYHFEIREKLLLLVLFIILMLWLFLHTTNIDMEEEPVLKHPTMQRLFEIAMQPVGNTMYIWGGGWDEGDKTSGAGSTRIGVSPTWKAFAEKQDATYNYEEYRYERELGLDCSGYVGWVVYNLFEKEDGKDGYVTFSTEMAESFANRGWGKLYKNPKQFLAGDIVSMDGHIWICLGTCKDGSVLLLHSSPPGVSICGTEIPKPKSENSDKRNQTIENEDVEQQNHIQCESTENKIIENPTSEDNLIESNKISVSVQLAETFMQNYYENWQTTYPNRSVSQTYLEDVTVMRWNVGTLSDAQKYQELSGEEILEFLTDYKQNEK